MLRFVALFSVLASVALANTQATFHHPQQQEHHRTMQSRSGFGVNAGFGQVDNGFGINGGFQVGNPLNSNLLFPVIVGLGLLSLFNIVLTLLQPLLNKSDDDAPADTDATAASRSMKAMDMINLANTVYEAIQKYNDQE